MICTQTMTEVERTLNEHIVERGSRMAQETGLPQKPRIAKPGERYQVPESEKTERTAASSTVQKAAPSYHDYGIADGATLKEMFNQWLAELEGQGFEPELIVEDNRIKKVRIQRDI